MFSIKYRGIEGRIREGGTGGWSATGGPGDAIKVWSATLEGVSKIWREAVEAYLEKQRLGRVAEMKAEMAKKKGD